MVPVSRTRVGDTQTWIGIYASGSEASKPGSGTL